MSELSPEDIKNGWTVQALEAYRLERERSAEKVAGFVVTQFVRPKPQTRIENTKGYSPHRW